MNNVEKMNAPRRIAMPNVLFLITGHLLVKFENNASDTMLKKGKTTTKYKYSFQAIPFVSYVKPKELIDDMEMFLVLCYEHVCCWCCCVCFFPLMPFTTRSHSYSLRMNEDAV